jgi:hypothetical protein
MQQPLLNTATAITVTDNAATQPRTALAFGERVAVCVGVSSAGLLALAAFAGGIAVIMLAIDGQLPRWALPLGAMLMGLPCCAAVSCSERSTSADSQPTVWP